MYRLIRPLLFRTDPDFSHELAQWFFRRQTLWRTISGLYRYEDPLLQTRLLGFDVPNPIGLAAGFDKNCEIARSMMALGFGFVTIGSVMRECRQGNPKPRISRRIPERALVNAMGLPSKGVRAIREKLSRLRREMPVIVSIGGHTVEDYCALMEDVGDYADAIEVNISCPNVERGTDFADDPELFAELAKQIAAKRTKPIVVKIPPYSQREDAKLREVVSICKRERFNGISATNTRKVDEPKISVKQGGLSGRPLLEETLRIVRIIYEETDGKFSIVGIGGVFAPGDVFNLIAQGASVTALYTGLIYEGPGLVGRLNKELARLLRERKFSSIAEIRGSAVKR